MTPGNEISLRVTKRRPFILSRRSIKIADQNGISHLSGRKVLAAAMVQPGDDDRTRVNLIPAVQIGNDRQLPELSEFQLLCSFTRMVITASSAICCNGKSEAKIGV